MVVVECGTQVNLLKFDCKRNLAYFWKFDRVYYSSPLQKNDHLAPDADINARRVARAMIILYAAWLTLLASIAALYRALILFERRPPDLAPDGQCDSDGVGGVWRRINTSGFCAQAAAVLFAVSGVGFVLHFPIEEAHGEHLRNGTHVT
jgi:hypothetical protein